MDPLFILRKLGQSIWYDNLRKGLVSSGEFKRMIDEYGVTGVTSNQSIFERAVSGTPEYDDDIEKLSAEGLTDGDIASRMLAMDARLAADALMDVYDRSNGKDGFVCIDMDARLADDPASMVREARALAALVDRPNIMVKVPATSGGIASIEELTFEGFNLNVTHLFSIERYDEAARAYVKGLERRVEAGRPIDGVSSVASFFVSRFDTYIDKRIEERATACASNDEKARLKALLGRCSVANARLALLKYREIFEGTGFTRLGGGANPLRLLWAATSVKDPRYRDIMYVEELAEDGTIIAMPLHTLLAFHDHGKARQRSSEDAGSSSKAISEMVSLGFDYGAIAETLLADALASQKRSQVLITEAIATKREALKEKKSFGASYSFSGFEGPLAVAIDGIGNENFLGRLWAKDPTIWKHGPEEKRLIKDSLGWLTLPDLMEDNIEAIKSFAAEVKKEGYCHAVLFGMGGSSLAPLVLRDAFGPAPGYPSLIVLDSTDPEAVRAVTREIDPQKTLFIVSSKSGTTIEPLSLFEYFYGLLYETMGGEAGRNFIAITDADTPLEGFSRKYGFKRLFQNPRDIGGRFSALSYFGLVPAAISGIDIERLIHSASGISAATHPRMKERENPVVMLGAALGIFGRAGRDKITFFLSREAATFGLWIEQLVAESTGKEGKGLVPVVDEPLGRPEDYGDDRVFVSICIKEEDRGLKKTLKALVEAGHPVISFRMKDIYELGGEFLRWEVATAVAGQVLGINPFDQPDVELAKKLTRARLLAIEKGMISPPGVEVAGKGLKVYIGEAACKLIKKRPAGNGDVKKALKDFMGLIKKGDYIGVLAYFDPNDRAIDETLRGLRKTLRDSTGAATPGGYGPRYLHSTGQLHKGGANKGVFLILCHETKDDIKIPGSAFSFSELELSQAFGDMEALDSRGCRVALVNIKGPSIEALREASILIKGAVESAGK
ncbi:MAG: bifunctional transaldolase/phosoglucose isomerase [Deltaproteobacteria bacterium]|nr:bifunctional transaldolase/phosoglucose isomerase [Deltaproteobacteria bacterium]